MQTPALHCSPAPTSHWLVATQFVQPVVCSWQVSTAPLAPQRFAPWVHVVAQATQLPAAQYALAGQRCAGPHTGQLFASVPQVSTPLPLQRVAPFVHEVPHVPHAPPEQNVAQV